MAALWVGGHLGGQRGPPVPVRSLTEKKKKKNVGRRCKEEGNHLEETEAPMWSRAFKGLLAAQDLDINALKSSRLEPPVDGDQAALLQTPAPQHG